MMYMHHESAIEGPCVCTSLRKAGRAVSRLYDEALEGAGLTTPQFAILRTIGRAGSVALSRLADALVTDRTSLYRSLDLLKRHGWVTIATSDTGRTKKVMLTDAGRAVIDAGAERWEQVQAVLVERIGAENWEALQALLRDVTTQAEAAR